ncbi:MAG TPA: ABC transporter permease [Acidimicrobiia bacterium]|nr:ABC transporter permease [Acidimicrobiia bacterium]
MRGFAAIVKVSLRQALGGKRVIVLGLLGLVPTLVMWLSSRNLTAGAAARRFYDAPFGILFLMVLPVCALVIGSGTMGDERRDGTLSFLLLRPMRRWVIVTAKFVAAWVASTTIVAASGLLAAITLGARSGDYAATGPIVLAVAISSAVYVAVFMLLGYLTSRAVLIGLVYVFIWESSITFAAAGLANVSLFRIGVTAYAALVPASRQPLNEVLGSLAPGAWGAMAKAVVITTLAVLALASLLRRRDALSE